LDSFLPAAWPFLRSYFSVANTALLTFATMCTCGSTTSAMS
jgi:hypothetical protein